MVLTYDQLDKNISEGLGSIYLLYGKEMYLIDTSLNKIKKKFGDRVQGINYITIEDANIDALISEIESPAFGYDKKLIVVRNSKLFSKDGRRKTLPPEQEKFNEFLKSSFDIIEDNAIIVFIEEKADKNDIYNFIEKNCIISNIEELKDFQLVKKLKQICALYKVEVDDNLLSYFVQRCGTNLQVLINEIRKLIEYAGPNGKITKESIDALTTELLDSEIFNLTDALGAGNMNRALEIYDELKYQKIDEAVIIASLFGHLERLYLTIYAVKLNKDIPSSIGIRTNSSFIIQKYKDQAKHFGARKLKTIMDALTKLDYDYKIGKIDSDIGLRSILCNYFN